MKKGKEGVADGIPRGRGRQHLGERGWVGDGYDRVHIFAPTASALDDPAAGDLFERCFGGAKQIGCS